VWTTRGSCFMGISTAPLHSLARGESRCLRCLDSRDVLIARQFSRSGTFVREIVHDFRSSPAPPLYSGHCGVFLGYWLASGRDSCLQAGKRGFSENRCGLTLPRKQARLDQSRSIPGLARFRDFRPKDLRIEAHIFVSFLAYCLYITLGQRLRALAPGLTARAVLEKMSAMQMVDVLVPTTDGRLLILPRYTQPEKDHQMLLHELHLQLPAQPPPRIVQSHHE